MGKLIDADKLKLKLLDLGFARNAYDIVEREISYLPTIEAIPKDQYEARLKADIVAMLTELQLEIEELEEEADIGKVVMIGAMDRMIQQKIDLLQKQPIDNCNNCFNGITKGGCAIKELMKNKDCKYYMPTENQCAKDRK